MQTDLAVNFIDFEMHLEWLFGKKNVVEPFDFNFEYWTDVCFVCIIPHGHVNSFIQSRCSDIRILSSLALAPESVFACSEVFLCEH